MTSILFFMTLKKIHAIADEDGDEAEAGEPLAEVGGDESEAGGFPADTTGKEAEELLKAEAENNMTVDSCLTETEKTAKNKKAEGGGKNEQETL